MKYPECQDCANYEADPQVCDICEDADMFESLDDIDSVQVVPLDELRRTLFTAKQPKREKVAA